MMRTRIFRKELAVLLLCLPSLFCGNAYGSDTSSSHVHDHSKSPAAGHGAPEKSEEKTDWSREVQDIILDAAVTVGQKEGLNLLRGSILVTPRFSGSLIRTAFGDIVLNHAYAEIVRVDNGVEIYLFSGSAQLKSLNQKHTFSIETGTMVTMKTTSRDGAFLLGLPKPIHVKEKAKTLVRLSRNLKELNELMAVCADGAQKVSVALAEAEKNFFNGVRDELAAEAARQDKLKREIASERQKLRKLYEQKTHQTD